MTSVADRLTEFLAYHRASMAAGDVDPAVPCLAYVADRFELNPEQRYWLAFLYACCYSGTTAFWIYNEFPDFECLTLDRLERWWSSGGRAKALFQSDRRWVRSRNQFVPMIRSYRGWVGPAGLRQAWRFEQCRGPTPQATYDRVFAEAGRCFQMGRFALFLWTEAVARIAGLPMEPAGLDLAHAESSRNGLCFALGRDDLVTGKETGKKTIPGDAIRWLDRRFPGLLARCREAAPGSTVWGVETTLCAFKKHVRHGGRRGPHWRHVGYYLDRQHDEIRTMEARVPEGVCWDVLWDWRREHIAPRWLKERR